MVDDALLCVRWRAGVVANALHCVDCPLVQGRSVKDVIHWGFAGPALFCFIWLSVFGGAGIRMERQVCAAGEGAEQEMWRP